MKIEDRDIIYEKVVGPMHENGEFPLTLADEVTNAIEKQIPKEVLNQHNVEYFTGECPNCKSSLAAMGALPYCHFCGQRLAWQ